MIRVKKRFLALALTVAMGFSIIPPLGETSTVEAATQYTPRFDAPARDNPYYTSLNPFHPAYGMVSTGSRCESGEGNCTCYAFGRAYELLGYRPSLSTGNAINFWTDNSSYATGQEPRLGAIAVWAGGSSGCGHVAVVEAINGDAVTISESGWNVFYFQTNTIYKSNNFYYGSAYTFKGFIYIGDFSTDTEPPVISNIKISNVTAKGYKVECDVSDNVGVTKVEMPTWTTKNDQDDLAQPWPQATLSGGHASFYVSVSDHNNESGNYATHIYAFDAAGNRSMKDAGITVVPASGSVLTDSSFVKPATTISQGNALSYGGKLSSDVNITKVKVGIYQATDSSTETVLENEVSPNSTSYTLTNEVLDTSTLGAGAYTVRIEATTSKKTTKLVEQALLVTASGQTVDEGEYIFKVAGNRNIALSVANASTDEGANVEVAAVSGDNDQNFVVEYIADGYYSIVNSNSGMALAVKGAGTSAGTTVVQATKNTGDKAQKWMILPAAGNTFCLVPAGTTGLVADARGGNCQAGDDVIISNMHFGANQRFALEVTVRCDKHTWNTGKLIKAATCTEDGAMKYTCKVCKFTETRTIKASGHQKIGEDEVVKEPSRFEDGVKEYTCSKCGETIQENFNYTWVDEINLDKNSMEIEVGKTEKLQATTSPEDAVETEVVWLTSDDSVATVASDGTVTAVGVGDVTITAAAADSFPPTTQYRYRTITDYETKTVTTKDSLGEGWEYVSESVSYGPWSDWSGWSTTARTKSDTVDVMTENVAATYKTQYKYSRYYGQSGYYYAYPWATGVCQTYEETNWLDSPLPDEWDGEFTGYGRGYNANGEYVTARNGSRWDIWWYNPDTRSVQASPAYTKYKYRTRTKTMNYVYRRPVWSDWSEWSTKPVEAASDKEVETRDVSGTVDPAVYAECKVTVNPKKLIGWQEIDGKKYYYNKNGVKLVGLQKINKAYYIFDDDGVMQTGLYTLGDKTYYMSAEGIVQRGLKTVDGKVFYFDNMGVKQDGWIEVSGNKYYFDAENGRYTGLKKIGGNWYYFNSKGVMRTGWLKSSGKYYYFNEDGTLAIGLVSIEGKKYYFASNGVMTTGWFEVRGKTYYFNTNGTMQTGWKKIGGYYYKFSSKGVMQTGWVQHKENWYYLQDDGKMLTNGTLTVGPRTYIFDENGVCTNP